MFDILILTEPAMIKSFQLKSICECSGMLMGRKIMRIHYLILIIM